MSPFHRDFKNAENHFLRKEDVIFCEKVLHRWYWRDVNDCEDLSDLFSSFFNLRCLCQRYKSRTSGAKYHEFNSFSLKQCQVVLVALPCSRVGGKGKGGEMDRL